MTRRKTNIINNEELSGIFRPCLYCGSPVLAPLGGVAVKCFDCIEVEMQVLKELVLHKRGLSGTGVNRNDEQRGS